jgi:hypothetical protein
MRSDWWSIRIRIAFSISVREVATVSGRAQIMVPHGLKSLPSHGLVRLEFLSWKNIINFFIGTYVQNAINEYTADIIGIAWVTFDSTSATKGTATPRIFVGT